MAHPESVGTGGEGPALVVAVAVGVVVAGAIVGVGVGDAVTVGVGVGATPWTPTVMSATMTPVPISPIRTTFWAPTLYRDEAAPVTGVKET
jgi:hypothetical protein